MTGQLLRRHGVIVASGSAARHHRLSELRLTSLLDLTIISAKSSLLDAASLS